MSSDMKKHDNTYFNKSNLYKRLIVLGITSVIGISGCSTINNSELLVDDSPSSLVPDSLVISPNDERKYATLTLGNELDVILVSDPSVEKSAVSLSVGVGLLQDPMTQQGMAHYLEHMLFLGTERFPDTDEYFEFINNNGGAANAYTWMDITNYMLEINNDAFPEAIDRFSDFFKAPKLYPEYTEKEINAVNAEWSMRREMDFFGQFKLARKMMGEHPANRFLIGNLETLGDKEGSLLHPETVAFFDQYYSSNIMKVAIISNRPLDEMRTLAATYFANIPNKNIDEPAVDSPLDLSLVGGKRVHYKPNDDVKQLVLDFTIQNNLDDFAVKPNEYIAYLIYSEMPGTPAQILRDKGWIASLTASALPSHYGNYGTFSINIELTDLGMQHRETIVASVMSYIDLIREQGVDEKYFTEIRTSLNNQFTFLEKGNSFNYVSNLTAAMQDYPVNNAINAPFYYAKFDAQAINNVLAQLTPDTLKIWYISQQEETDSTLHFYDGNYRITNISDAEINSWQQASPFALSLPKVNTLLPENFDLKQTDVAVREAPTLVYDKNDIKIWQFASSRFANQPKGLTEIFINNPSPINSIESKVLLSIWADLYQLNTAALTTEASIAGMSMRLTPTNGLVLTVNGFTDKQPELLSAALEAMTIAPSEQDFAQAVDRYIRSINNAQRAFPVSQSFAKYRKLIREGTYDDEALIKTAQQVTVAQLNAFIDVLVSNNQVRVFVYGNHDSNDIESIGRQLAQTLPNNRNLTPYKRSARWLPQEGQVLSYQKDLEVADVAVLDLYMHPQNTYLQKAAGQILATHMRTIAFNKLRTEEQLAYSVGAFSPVIDEYTGLGLYIQTPVKDPKAMQTRFNEFKLQYLEELNAITPEFFEQLKNAELLNLREQPKNLSEEVAPFLSDWYRERFAFDSKAKQIEATEQVKLEDLKTFYMSTMMNEKAARLNIQLRGSKFADAEFAELPGQTVIESIEDLRKLMQYQQ